MVTTYVKPGDCCPCCGHKVFTESYDWARDIGYESEWVVRKQTRLPSYVTIARTDSQSAAEQIARALNAEEASCPSE